MYIKEVCLTNIRKFNRKTIQFKKGINIIYGNNGSGKTTILESINMLSVGKSFQTYNTQNVIKENEKQYNIKATTNTKDIIEIKGDRYNKKIETNKSVVKKISNHIGFLPSIYSTPDSILYQGKNNHERQKNINQALCFLNPNYIKALKNYNLILKQRNRALKQQQNQHLWDNQLAENAQIIWKKREEFIKNLNQEILKIKKNVEEIQNVKVFLKEVETDLKKIKENILLKKAEEEVLGRTLYGPHKDQIKIFINNKSIKNKASQGEKSLCFSILKKAEANLIKKETNKDPIILLDDIFSKLDRKNSNTLFKLFSNNDQTIISHTNQIKNPNTHNISING